jgi:hypothetical protein
MRAFQPSRSASMGRKGWAVAAVAILLILGAIGTAWLNPRLTHYLESDRFRAELERQTAKGLHFPDGHYAPIHRKGFLTAAADRFQADNGRKALRAIDAHPSRPGLIRGEYSSGAGSSTTFISIQAKSKSKPTRPARSRARPNPGSTFSSRSAFISSMSKRIQPT